MTGFHADPAALDGLAVRLEDTADEFASAAADVEATASGDLGPPAISAALTALTGEWSGRIRAVRTDYAAAADNVRAAAKAFRGSDTNAAETLDRIAARPDPDGIGNTASTPHGPTDSGHAITPPLGSPDPSSPITDGHTAAAHRPTDPGPFGHDVSDESGRADG
jgi:hypothetical protein